MASHQTSSSSSRVCLPPTPQYPVIPCVLGKKITHAVIGVEVKFRPKSNFFRMKNYKIKINNK